MSHSFGKGTGSADGDSKNSAKIPFGSLLQHRTKQSPQLVFRTPNKSLGRRTSAPARLERSNAGQGDSTVARLGKRTSKDGASKRPAKIARLGEPRMLTSSKKAPPAAFGSSKKDEAKQGSQRQEVIELIDTSSDEESTQSETLIIEQKMSPSSDDSVQTVETSDQEPTAASVASNLKHKGTFKLDEFVINCPWCNMVGTVTANDLEDVGLTPRQVKVTCHPYVDPNWTPPDAFKNMKKYQKVRLHVETHSEFFHEDLPPLLQGDIDLSRYRLSRSTSSEKYSLKPKYLPVLPESPREDGQECLELDTSYDTDGTPSDDDDDYAPDEPTAAKSLTFPCRPKKSPPMQSDKLFDTSTSVVLEERRDGDEELKRPAKRVKSFLFPKAAPTMPLEATKPSKAVNSSVKKASGDTNGDDGFVESLYGDLETAIASRATFKTNTSFVDAASLPSGQQEPTAATLSSVGWYKDVDGSISVRTGRGHQASDSGTASPSKEAETSIGHAPAPELYFKGNETQDKTCLLVSKPREKEIIVGTIDSLTNANGLATALSRLPSSVDQSKMPAYSQDKTRRSRFDSHPSDDKSLPLPDVADRTNSPVTDTKLPARGVDTDNDQDDTRGVVIEATLQSTATERTPAQNVIESTSLEMSLSSLDREGKGWFAIPKLSTLLLSLVFILLAIPFLSSTDHPLVNIQTIDICCYVNFLAHCVEQIVESIRRVANDVGWAACWAACTALVGAGSLIGYPYQLFKDGQILEACVFVMMLLCMWRSVAWVRSKTMPHVMGVAYV